MLFLLPQCNLSHLGKLSPVKWIASNCGCDITKQNRPNRLVREGFVIEGSNLFIPLQRIKTDILCFSAWLGSIFCKSFSFFADSQLEDIYFTYSYNQILTYTV
ncbi:hypothetical protein ATANTOWER_018281 [Ataeniobius toweri]|uniref:Uncharacterized protein n=1 Tax=Ataeniobius toweri TaxID=208326 RepID=A0ABU7AH65_9TELE|nr:hypothetical protein [Ataeniobius toweri]